MELKYYLEDVTVRFKISKNQKPISVHIHTVDSEKRMQVVDLPFTVKRNYVTAILPANTKILTDPELHVEIIGEKMTDEKADKIINNVHSKYK